MRRGDWTRIVVLILVVVVGLAVTATFAVGRAYRSLADPTAAFPQRPAFVSAPDPILRAGGGLDPNATDIAPGLPRPELRTIEVFPASINLLQGGQVTRRIPLPGPVVTPQEIVSAIADPQWMRTPVPGEVVVEAALIMRPGTTLVAAAPLRRIVLQTQPGVFLGGADATLRFEGVDVEASDRAVPRDGEVGAGNRPFVVAQGGRMEITGSAFRYLGRDWNDSYGVSWTKGAGGFATRSTFEHNMMGLFAATAIDLRWDSNQVRHNVLFGMDAHQVSAGLLIEDNVVEDNGRDGIILSDNVIGGIVRYNTLRTNALNAILLVAASDDNVVSLNVAESNGGDGIVVTDSSGNTVERNTLRDNRVAVGVYGEASSGNVVARNTIDQNGLAVQGLDPVGNTVLANGDYWRPTALVVIWAAAAALVVGLLWLTRWSRSRRVDMVGPADREWQRVRTGANR